MTNDRRNRREFLGLTGVGIAGAISGQWACAPSGGRSPDADLVVFNAKVYTVDPAQPTAEAFAVKDNHFIAVGSNADIKGLIGKGTESIDAKQMTVIPGCIDCHNHAGGTGLLYGTNVGNPFEAEMVTIASIVQTLKAKAQETPAGQWVTGGFFDDQKVKDNRALSINDLDEVSKDHPVSVRHRGGHTSYYNSKAFELAGVTKNTPNPPGGTFDKDANGALNGRVTDRAGQVFQNVGKRETFTPEQTAQRNRDGLAYISKMFVKYGLTTVHHQGGDLSAMQDVRARGELMHRVNLEIGGNMQDTLIAAGIKSGFGDDWIRYGDTSEHTIDGSFSERTAAVAEPFLDTEPPYKGNVTEKPDVLNPWVEKMARAGIVPNIHANGEVAIDEALTAFELSQKAFPVKDWRPKITHCTIITPDLVKRMKALDVIPACFTTYAYYNGDKFHFYGEERMNRCMAFRTFLDNGIHAAAGSDFGPGPFAPLMGIQGMVTRKGFNGQTWGASQKVSVDEAIQINSLNGAYAAHEEGIKGSITPGKLADFLLLAEDPHTVDPEKIKDIKIVKTVVGGKTMYQA